MYDKMHVILDEKMTKFLDFPIDYVHCALEKCPVADVHIVIHTPGLKVHSDVYWKPVMSLFSSTPQSAR